MTQNETDQIVLTRLADNAPDGYIYEVDLDYPSHLHRKHNAYLFAPERLTIDETILSPLHLSWARDGDREDTPSINRHRLNHIFS